MGDTLVALAMPRGCSAVRNNDAARAFYRPTKRGVNRVEMNGTQTSLAIRCFNLLLCQALNIRREHPVTHFAMQHDDVCPDEGWLDTLLDELDATGADMVSAVIPIKNGAGITSTAVDMDGAPWVVRRLTMHEVYELPETFGLEDIGWRLPVSQLLLNTGLWCLRLGEWFDRLFPVDNPTRIARVAPLAFKDHARIVQLPDGEYVSEDISEDWDWARQLNGLSLKLAATRKVGLYHERPEFHNRQPWGAWQTDEGYARCMKSLAESAA